MKHKKAPVSPDTRAFLDGLKAVMDTWDESLKIVLAAGYTQAQAEEIVGRYFREQFTRQTKGE